MNSQEYSTTTVESASMSAADEFNAFGALAIIELAGETDVANSIRSGDWRVMERVSSILHKGVFNAEDDDEQQTEALEAVDLYFNLLGRYLGVYPMSVEDVGRVIVNLSKYVSSSDRKFLGDAYRSLHMPNGSGYLECLYYMAKCTDDNVYYTHILTRCAKLIHKDMELTLDSDEDSD